MKGEFSGRVQVWIINKFIWCLNNFDTSFPSPDFRVPPESIPLIEKNVEIYASIWYCRAALYSVYPKLKL